MSRRDQLVEHMSESIREKGVGASTIQHVLEASGVTAGSMYHYFPAGKEALVAAAVEKAGAEGAELLEHVMASSSQPTHGTRVFFTDLATAQEESDFRFGCPVGVPSTEAPVIEAVRAAGSAAFQSWITVIAAALQERGFSSERAESVAGFVVAAYEGASTVSRTLQDTTVIYDTMAMIEQLLTDPHQQQTVPVSGP